MQEVVGIVFEDKNVVLLRCAVDVAAALLALGRAGWVLAGWDGVEEPGFRGTARLGVPGSEEGIHVGG